MSALIAGLLCAGQGVVVARPVAPQSVSLNFPNTDVDAVARAMAAIMGRPVVVDPRVVGKITLYTDTPVSSAQAHAMFAAALRGAGYALVESQGLLKVVPEAEGKVQAGSLRTDGSAPGQDVVGTQVFRLQHENASSMVTVLRPLISANNTINVNAGNNSLVITDYASNLRRLERLIAALDTPSATISVSAWV
ncbi:secretin N-terminal domain-containing protein, partial [Aquabacterium sp.]|uniref:secretin N-terminal domain-containing protein n=1 Tax=Aquabacterium sp. TaxID=1872578 RepID=UPI0025BDD688